MISIGMLRKNGEPGVMATACALVAHMEEVSFFYFTPEKIDFNQKTIHAQVYESGHWIERETPYPDVVYNDTPKQHEDVYEKLEQETLFTAHKEGSKTKVFNKIKENGKMAEFLIPTVEFDSLEQLHTLIDKYTSIVIKPESGNQGKGIIYIEKGSTYKIMYDKQEKSFDQQQLHDFINTYIDQNYVIQPFIESRTKDGQPYDIRAHVQKDGEGEWVLTRLYARIGTKDTIVSNVAAGGSIGKIEGFLKREFEESNYNKLKNKLETFSVDFASHFQSLYKVSFDELGIDLTIDNNGNIYVFEVNRKPSVKGLLELESASNLIPYAKHLVQNHKPTILEIPENKRENLSIFFGGDTFLGRAGKSLLKEKGYDYPFADLRDLLVETDVKSVNLEAPISKQASKLTSDKTYKYRLPKKGLRALSEEGINIFYLANNHTIDYGHQGLLETVEYLSEQGLTALGAGKNEMNARSGVGIMKGNEKIGLLNYMSYRKSYHERYQHFAYHETSGVAVLEEKKVRQDIASLRRRGFETIVVSVHWGRNYEPITNKQKRESEMLIHAGADVIVGHGSHDYQPIEIQKGVPIFYSLGNFVFTTHGRTDFKYGFPITLSFEKNQLAKAEIWPISTNNKVVDFQPKHLKGDESKDALEELFEASTLSGKEYEITNDRGVVYF